MSRKSKGTRNERRGREFLEDAGFTVIRSAGSFGIADLVCFGRKKVYFINAKTNNWAPPKERQAMVMFRDGLKIRGVENTEMLLMRFDDGDIKPKFKILNGIAWYEYEIGLTS